MNAFVFSIRSYLSKISFKQFALRTLAQMFDRFFFDLSCSLPGYPNGITDLFKRHLLAANAVKSPDHFAFFIRKYLDNLSRIFCRLKPFMFFATLCVESMVRFPRSLRFEKYIMT